MRGWKIVFAPIPASGAAKVSSRRAAAAQRSSSVRRPPSPTHSRWFQRVFASIAVSITVLETVVSAAPLPAPLQPPAVVAPERDPRPIAQRHLRKAKEYLGASCELLKKGDRHAIDGYYVACEEAWNAVWVCPGDPAILCEAAELYADGLAGFLESACQHGRIAGGGVWVGPPSKPVFIPLCPKALSVGVEQVKSIEPQPQRGDKRITRRHVRDGFGLPVVVRTIDRSRDAPAPDFMPARQSLAATAVLRFKMPGDENFLETFAGPVYRDHAPAMLDLANPIEIAAVHIGPARPHLAADLTAPLLDMLASMPQSGVEGYLQPFGQGATRPRLEFLQPHEPGKIPVVFIHGLASDEGTWFDLVNELRAWPEFHRRFEPWVFHYPTGTAFLRSSSRLRAELRRAVRALDPEGHDPALKNIVLVGHSMGGLHAKLQVVAPGNSLWDAVACRPFDQLDLDPPVRQFIGEAYFFEPLPFVNRVVCIATPHRGSILASLGIGRLASISVRPPPQLVAIHKDMLRRNPGAFRPDFEQRVPSTVDMLEPNSTVLQALERLRPSCWVTVHSIVGNGHVSLTGGRDDCVVSVASAHTVGAVSEIMVPATHTKVHHHPLTVAEVQRILVQHLQETGLGAGAP
jgi:hypothetical protein